MFRTDPEDEEAAKAAVMSISRHDLVDIIKDRLEMHEALKRGAEIPGLADAEKRVVKRRKKWVEDLRHTEN